MRAWISIVLGAATLGCLLILFSWRARDKQAAASVLVADSAASGSDLTDLKRDVEFLKVRSKSPQVVMVAPSDRGEESAQKPQNPEQEKATSRERLRQIAATLEHKFAAESVDPAWSDQRSRDIREAVGAQDPRTIVSSVTCGATLCKLVLDHDTVAAQRDLTANLGDLEPFHAGVFYNHDESANPPRTTLYVLREGHDFNQIFPNP